MSDKFKLTNELVQTDHTTPLRCNDCGEIVKAVPNENPTGGATTAQELTCECDESVRSYYFPWADEWHSWVQVV